MKTKHFVVEALFSDEDRFFDKVTAESIETSLFGRFGNTFNVLEVNSGPLLDGKMTAHLCCTHATPAPSGPIPDPLKEDDEITKEG